MNRTEAKELLPVITAFANGEECLWRKVGEPDWRPCISPGWEIKGIEYRIVPKPKTCERWFFAAFYPDGSSAIRESNTEDSAKENHERLANLKTDATFSPIVRVEFVEEQT